MSTWQIFSDAGENFRWEICSPMNPLEVESPRDRRSSLQRHGSDSRLPSMRDLLFQGYPRLMEDRSGGIPSLPMFQTGLGKAVAVKQSSVAKALSVLGDGDSTDAECPKLPENGGGGVVSHPMFHTGSGKSVAFKQSSVAKALSVIDEGGFVDGCPELLENGSGEDGSYPMFQTGSGKSVIVKQTSIAKALSVLGDDDSTDAVSGENNHRSPNSHFRTGSGKMVNISSAATVKAKTLLGLEENDSCHNFRGLEHMRKLSTANELHGWQNLSCPESRSAANNIDINDDTVVPRPLIGSKTVVSESVSKIESIPNLMHLETCKSALKPAPIKFCTAGGRSILVSSDALQRARSLLGQPALGASLDEANAEDPVFSVIKSGRFDCPFDQKNDCCASFSPQKTPKSKAFVSPLRSASAQLKPSIRTQNMHYSDNLIKQFDAAQHDSVSWSSGKIPSVPHIRLKNSSECGSNQQGRSSIGPLVDISNTITAVSADKKHTVTEKRKLGRRTSISPFKRPRNSKFITPLNGRSTFVSNGFSTLSTEGFCCKRRVCTKYPFQAPRMYVKEYFGGPPYHHDMLENLSDQIRWMNPDSAGDYMFYEKSGLECMGVESFCQLLFQSGASLQYASKEWVANHYKWIVWKLACYERCYPAKSTGTFLTASNVLEDLKYRYEREVNHGHHSAIKRILEGDASPSSMMILCVSAIYSICDLKIETLPEAGAENGNVAKLELTDGWYSIDAYLDTVLAKQLNSGKLHLGQKLRIWGAGLCGRVGPVSPLQIPREASLLLHVNGTYRAHWADRLGLCKGVGAPLAFRCIRSGGGPVPLTMVGVKRIYPVLFKERLGNGGFIVRSERMETKMMQLHNQRRSIVVEGIISEFERSMKDSYTSYDNDSEEGAKILRMLETTSEPEVLMAEMSSEQLNSFSTYQAKLEANRQSEMQKSIEKSLDDAGLSVRDVTPFMRVRVVGLTSRSHKRKGCRREGLITIWNPTDKQKFELLEGQAYAVPGLIPLKSDSHTLYLQARGSSIRWQPLSPTAVEHFKPFFSPRQSVLLSNLAEVPLSSEFDIAALIVYVGEVYTTLQQKQQWVFVTDGSISELQSEDLSSYLLAISFCLPCTEDSFAPINRNLVGSIVCFCNLIKRAKDQRNHLWIAEASENSTYFLRHNDPYCCHLQNAAAVAEKWAKVSSLTIEKLKEKVQFIIGNCEG